jgi:ATP-dependent Clp protease ATP-binding subunit ClpC
MSSAPLSYSPHAQAALVAAAREAEKTGNNYIGPEHLFLAMLHVERCRAVKMLRQFKLTIAAMEQELRKAIHPGLLPGLEHEYSLNASASMVLALATEEAKLPGPDYPAVGTEHLLLGILLESDNLAAQVLKKLGVTVDKVRQAIAAHV